MTTIEGHGLPLPLFFVPILLVAQSEPHGFFTAIAAAAPPFG